MEKVICDICGTSYPENAEQCPICGYAPGAEVAPLTDDEDFVFDESLLDDVVEEEVAEDVEATKILPVVAVAEAVDADDDDDKEEDEDNEEDDEDEEEDDEEEDEAEEEGKRRPSGFLIALLVIVIIALLGVTGFIFARYYLPGLRGENATEAPAVETTEAVVETAAPTVPCTSLAMTSDSEVLLEQPGNSWLINVVTMPENTTDEVIFLSNNLEVATVDADGTVTAVGEGSAVISVICGDFTIECNITCAFVDEPTVPDETSTEPTTEEDAEETEEATEEATEAPAEEPTEEPTEAPTEPATDVKLALSKADVSFDRVGVYYTLKVANGIDPKDVEWTTSNSRICVVKDGVITITGPGVATVTAKYYGQEATCVVRVVINK